MNLLYIIIFSLLFTYTTQTSHFFNLFLNIIIYFLFIRIINKEIKWKKISEE